jgi:hypothetical protein
VKKKGRIAKYSAEESAAVRARGRSHSDWEKSAAMTTRNIELSVASDPDEADMIVDWSKASTKT